MQECRWKVLNKLSRTIEVRIKGYNLQGREEVRQPHLPPLEFTAFHFVLWLHYSPYLPSLKTNLPKNPPPPSPRSPNITKAECYRQTPQTECALRTRQGLQRGGGEGLARNLTTQQGLVMAESRKYKRTKDREQGVPYLGEAEKHGGGEMEEMANRKTF